MARRIGWGVGLGAGLQDFGNTVNAIALQQTRLKAQREGQLLGEQATSLREIADRVAKGEYTPDQADAVAHAQGIPVPAGHFRNAEPSVTSRLSGILKNITDAESFQKVPGEQAIGAAVKAARVPISFGEMDRSGPPETTRSGNLPSRQMGPVQPELTELLNIAKEKRASFPPIKQSITNPDESTEDRYVSADPATLTGQSFPTGVSATQKGQNELAKWMANEGSTQRTNVRIATENAMEAGTRGQKIETANQTEEATRAGKVKTAAATASAEASARKAAEIKAEIAQYGMTGQQATNAFKLRDDFTNESKNFFIREDQMRVISTVANDPSAAGDLALIFSFMKMIDPGSTVREGEQAMAQNAAGVPERIRNLYNRMLTGERLAPDQKQDFVKQAANIYSSDAVGHRERVQRFTADAARVNVPGEFVVRPPSPSAEAAAKSAPNPGKSLLDTLRSRGAGAGRATPSH